MEGIRRRFHPRRSGGEPMTAGSGLVASSVPGSPARLLAGLPAATASAPSGLSVTGAIELFALGVGIIVGVAVLLGRRPVRTTLRRSRRQDNIQRAPAAVGAAGQDDQQC